MNKYVVLALFIPFLIAGCSSPRAAYHPDAEIERNAAAAKSAYAAGSMANASVFYQKALDRARFADQSGEIARLAYNLAACRAQMQKYNEALELLDEAEFEAARAAGPPSRPAAGNVSGTGVYFPEAVLLKVEILRHLGQTNEAWTMAESGRDALNNKKDGPARLRFQVFLAELACDRNDGKLALQELDRLDANLLKSSDANLQAKAAQARGRALLMEKRPAEAAVCFDKSAALYQKAQRYTDMALALQNAGNALETANNRPAALNRLYRAARSLFICGENIKAQESFNKAGELAKESDDKQMLNALARLKAENRSGER